MKKKQTKTLHIFIDESGNFEFDKEGGSRFYVISFVLSESDSFSKEKKELLNALYKIDKNIDLIHTSPLIRQKGIYMNISLEKRIKALETFLSFAEKIKIKTFVCASDKNNCKNLNILQKDLKRKIKASLQKFSNFLCNYAKITIHYDNGQKELTDIIKSAFSNSTNTVTFNFDDTMKNQILIQISDVIATLYVINEKFKYSKTTYKEREFFNTKLSFKTNYFSKIRKLFLK